MWVLGGDECGPCEPEHLSGFGEGLRLEYQVIPTTRKQHNQVVRFELFKLFNSLESLILAQDERWRRA